MKKRKQKKHNARAAVHRPDEEFSAGPLHMARFGRHVVSQTSWPPGEFEKFQDRLVEGYAEVVRDIDRDIESASALVVKLDPLVLLHRAWWERSAATLGMESEVEVRLEHAYAARMIDYVQSLVAATPRGTAEAEKPSDADWARLKELVESIFQKLNARYFICATAQRRRNEAKVDDAFEEFHFGRSSTGAMSPESSTRTIKFRHCASCWHHRPAINPTNLRIEQRATLR
jgi:hypothetical protein